MAAILPPGKRAIATGISVVTSAGGFILPNDRVDVIMVRPNPSGGEFLTEVILSNIRVLAIDQTIQDQDGQRSSLARPRRSSVAPAGTDPRRGAADGGTPDAVIAVDCRTRTHRRRTRRRMPSTSSMEAAAKVWSPSSRTASSAT